MSKWRHLGTALLATYAVVAVGSSQLMICFHRDGRTQLELATLVCCEKPAPSSAQDCPDGCGKESTMPCPDDQCQDMQLTHASHQIFSTPVLDMAAPVAEIWLADLADIDLQTPTTSREDSSHSRGHPPESSSRDFLRTVILRL